MSYTMIGQRVRIKNSAGSFMKDDQGREVLAKITRADHDQVYVDAYPVRRLSGWYRPECLTPEEDD